MRQLKDVVQYDLFPSADMILSMSKEYGTEQWEQRVGADKMDIPCPLDRMKRYAPLDTHNRQYMKHWMFKQGKNFIQVCRLELLNSISLVNRDTHMSGTFSRTILKRCKSRVNVYRSQSLLCSGWSCVQPGQHTTTASRPSTHINKPRSCSANKWPRFVELRIQCPNYFKETHWRGCTIYIRS